MKRVKSAANERVKSAAKGNAERGKSTAKPDHYDAAVLRDIFARNPWMDVADGLTFEESERVNFDPATGLVVKAGTPGTVPLGEVVLFVPPTDGRGAFAAIFTDEKFYREYTLTGKDRPPC